MRGRVVKAIESHSPNGERTRVPNENVARELAPLAKKDTKSAGRVLDDLVEEHGEMVEKELNHLIERRSPKGELEPDELEPGYVESVRRYREARRREAAELWRDYHEHMRELHERLAAEHASKASALLGEGAQG